MAASTCKCGSCSCCDLRLKQVDAACLYFDELQYGRELEYLVDFVVRAWAIRKIKDCSDCTSLDSDDIDAAADQLCGTATRNHIRYSLEDLPTVTGDPAMISDSDCNCQDEIDALSNVISNLTFLDLADTPANYSGASGKYVRVKSDGSGLEFNDVSSGVSSFLGLSDTPGSYSGQGGKSVRVNADGTALEFYVPALATTPTLAEVLVAGNTTGGTNVITSNGDAIKAASGGGQLNLREGADDTVSLTTDNGAFSTSSLLLDPNMVQLVSRNYTAELVLIDDSTTNFALLHSSIGGFHTGALASGIFAVTNPGVSIRDVSAGDATSQNMSAEPAIFVGARNSTIKSGTNGVVMLGTSGHTGKTSQTAYVNQLGFWDASTNEGLLNNAALAADRAWTLPDATGTILLKEQIDTQVEFEALLFTIPTGGAGTLAEVATASSTTAHQTFLGDSGQRVVWQQDISGAKEIWGYSDTEMVFNDGGIDYDYRWEGVSRPTALFIQGSDGFLGVGMGSPTAQLHVQGSGATSLTFAIVVENSVGTDIFSVRNDGLFKLGYLAGLNDATGGVTNTYAGYSAGRTLSSGTNDVFVGYLAGDVTNGSNSTIVGSQACRYKTSANDVIIGYTAAGNSANALGIEGNVIIGYQAAYTLDGGSRNVIIGLAAGASTGGGDFNVLIGTSANSTSNAQGQIAIGTSASATADHQIVIGGDHSIGYMNAMYLGRGVTSTTPNNFLLTITGASGSNATGNMFTIAAGPATGTGVAGDLILQTSVLGSDGSTLQTLGDRARLLGKYTDLTESTATAFASVSVPTGTVCGGYISYTVEANDGTNFQSISGVVAYTIVNKAGTLTLSLSSDLQTGGAASGAGSLTCTITLVDATGGIAQFKANAASSLTQTVLRINAQVYKNFGTGAIAAV